jgi:hypothetical protein
LRDLNLFQQHAFHKLKKVKKSILYASVGEGKSRVALKLVATLQQKRTLVVIVCRRKAFYDWKNEIKKIGYKDWRVQSYNSDSILFYTGVTVWFVSADLLDKCLLDLSSCEIDYIIFDELYLFSNVKAKRTKAAINLVEVSKNANVIGLSGTIMPAQDNTSIWGQTRTIGIHDLLARNLTEFRKQYQNCQLVQMGSRNVPIIKNKAGSEKAILDRLASNVYLHFPKTDERKITEKFNEVPQTQEQKALIKQLKEEYYVRLSEGEELDIKTATALVAKIQQISNGYIKSNTGNIYSIKSNKCDALEQSVTEALAAGEQVLIWCAFRYDLDYLSEKLSVATLQLKGGSEFDLKTWQSGDVNVVLATEGSGSSVNHFVGVRYAKYFSLNYRWLDLQQSRGRTGGKRAHHKGCHYEYFFTDGTLDRHIYDTANKSGKIETDFIRKWIEL